MRDRRALAGLLELIRSSGGCVETRIRIQKEAFLLAIIGAPHFRPESFSYHHYGPFSRELSDILQFAVSAGLVREQRRLVGEDGEKYTYYLTDEGERVLEEMESDLLAYAPLIRNLNSYPWRALELAATAKYLQCTGAVESREAAITHTLRLKPETLPFQDQARRVINELDSFSL